jgi:uncharacterized repeat protein (TIGR01451 family)
MNFSKRAGLVITSLLALAGMSTLSAAVPEPKPVGDNGMFTGYSYQNDVSLPLYYLPSRHDDDGDMDEDERGKGEAPENPALPNHHRDSADPVVQHTMAASREMPTPILNFDGIVFPGVGCNCAPPDTNGEVGTTQYLQMVNEGFQVFDKATGASVLGPQSISSVWAGFGGVCETSGHGDPVVLFDQIADRWLISQFAGGSIPTDECIAISTSDDATGTWNRYAFHLGSSFFDYPHLGVWPDGYYMSMNVFNSSGTAFLGPQAFAFDRQSMLQGHPATFVTPGITGGPNEDFFLPADMDGATTPPLGAPNPFVEYPGNNTYRVRQFHADFATPGNSTFTLFGSPAAAGFTSLCVNNRACVPQLGGTGGNAIDGIGDRLMFRLAYRNFGDHESLVGNFTVKSSNVAGVRWFELRGVTDGPVSVFQESTYQPDTDWRWLGSVAMDSAGNLAVGFSASSATIHPQLRYAGRLSSDPPNQLAQGESHLFDGNGSQTGSSNRWGDYSALTVDPVDDCTFWYTNEYYGTTGSFNWRTRIGNFKFSQCGTAGFTLAATPHDVSVCAGTPATYSVNVGSVSGFGGAVTLAASGNPSPSTAAFAPNPVTTLPGTSTLTINNTGGVASGTYPITITGTASGAASQTTAVNLTVSSAVPAAATLTAPANNATNVDTRPTFTWTGTADSYVIDVATDSAFSNIVYTATVDGTSATPDADLDSNTHYYWRVTAANACGSGSVSATFSFTTAPLAGDCSSGQTAQTIYSYGFESGLNGWTLGSGSIGNTWADSGDAHSGSHSWKATDSTIVSDQRFVSPSIALPTGQDPLTLSFWHKRDLEQNGATGCYDGGILEISTDGGATFSQLGAPDLLTDPYDGSIATTFGNPLAGDDAWCGTKDWTRSIVDLSLFGGDSVQLRYRLGSDSSNGGDGWAIDDVQVQSCEGGGGPTTFVVTPVAGPHGSIAPSTPQTIDQGQTTTFTVTPDSGYAIDSVTGCGGSLSGSTYTTGPITADCTVNASFAAVSGDVAVTIDDGRTFAQYGADLTYTIVVSNTGSTSATGISVANPLPAELVSATWTCAASSGATCTPSGTGGVSDSGVTVPAGGNVTYTLHATVAADSTSASVTDSVTVTDAVGSHDASDTDTLVIFRGGFEAGEDGGTVAPTAPAVVKTSSTTTAAKSGGVARKKVKN